MTPLNVLNPQKIERFFKGVRARSSVRPAPFMEVSGMDSSPLWSQSHPGRPCCRNLLLWSGLRPSPAQALLWHKNVAKIDTLRSFIHSWNVQEWFTLRDTRISSTWRPNLEATLRCYLRIHSRRCCLKDIYFDGLNTDLFEIQWHNK